jgi:hypothetical protein
MDGALHGRLPERRATWRRIDNTARPNEKILLCDAAPARAALSPDRAFATVRGSVAKLSRERLVRT